MNRLGPFGLSMGMSTDELGEGFEEVSPAKYMTSNVPKPHSAFERYYLQITPNNGLSWIKALGKSIVSNGYGFEVKSAFDAMRTKLETTYGKSEISDFLMHDSIWNEPRDWLMGLAKKERYLMASWDLKKGKILPNSLVSVALFASAVDQSSGYIAIEYYFENAEASDKEIAAWEDDAL